MSEWKPIETAPKDGSVFLVAPYEDEHVTASWRWGHFVINCCGQRADGFTHWMPLPEPPQ